MAFNLDREFITLSSILCLLEILLATFFVIKKIIFSVCFRTWLDSIILSKTIRGLYLVITPVRNK